MGGRGLFADGCVCLSCAWVFNWLVCLFAVVVLRFYAFVTWLVVLGCLLLFELLVDLIDDCTLFVFLWVWLA